MKNIIPILCSLLILAGCSPKIYPNEPQGTIYLGSPAEGLVSVRSTGEGSGYGQATDDAIKSAFETIILHGLPQYSGLKRPLLSQDEASKLSVEAPNFFDDFVSKGTYEQFITEQRDPEDVAVKKGKRVTKDMTINIKNLRMYLENAGWKRKFGY